MTDGDGGSGRDRESDAGSVRVAATEAEREDAFDVRTRVFVEEQGVPQDVEWDGHDADAIHFVAYADGDGTDDGSVDSARRAVGAARLRTADAEADAEADADGTVGKVERVAVLDAERGEGWGERLMDVLEATARDRGFDALALHAQRHAAGFYDRLDYRRVGEEFEEVGIPHVEMRKRL